MRVGLEVLGQILDRAGQQRDLHLGEPDVVALVGSVLGDDLVLDVTCSAAQASPLYSGNCAGHPSPDSHGRCTALSTVASSCQSPRERRKLTFGRSGGEVSSLRAGPSQQCVDQEE